MTEEQASGEITSEQQDSTSGEETSQEWQDAVTEQASEETQDESVDTSAPTAETPKYVTLEELQQQIEQLKTENREAASHYQSVADKQVKQAKQETQDLAQRAQDLEEQLKLVATTLPQVMDEEQQKRFGSAMQYQQRQQQARKQPQPTNVDVMEQRAVEALVPQLYAMGFNPRTDERFKESREHPTPTMFIEQGYKALNDLRELRAGLQGQVQQQQAQEPAQEKKEPPPRKDVATPPVETTRGASNPLTMEDIEAAVVRGDKDAMEKYQEMLNT